MWYPSLTPSPTSVPSRHTYASSLSLWEKIFLPSSSVTRRKEFLVLSSKFSQTRFSWASHIFMMNVIWSILTSNPRISVSPYLILTPRHCHRSPSPSDLHTRYRGPHYERTGPMSISDLASCWRSPTNQISRRRRLHPCLARGPRHPAAGPNIRFSTPP
jgi:hypothetical protein